MRSFSSPYPYVLEFVAGRMTPYLARLATCVTPLYMQTHRPPDGTGSPET